MTTASKSLDHVSLLCMSLCRMYSKVIVTLKDCDVDKELLPYKLQMSRGSRSWATLTSVSVKDSDSWSKTFLSDFSHHFSGGWWEFWKAELYSHFKCPCSFSLLVHWQQIDSKSISGVSTWANMTELWAAWTFSLALSHHYRTLWLFLSLIPSFLSRWWISEVTACRGLKLITLALQNCVIARLHENLSFRISFQSALSTHLNLYSHRGISASERLQFGRKVDEIRQNN